MTSQQDAYSELRAVFTDRFLQNEPLARHTSARIGGPADGFLAVDSQDDLRRAAEIAWQHNIPLFILGGGSNILISDAGVRGLVVHNRTNDVHFDGETVRADSGVSTIMLCRRLQTRGLSGFEWAVGIPGTLGGAAYGNAGAHGGDMAGCVTSVDAVTPDGLVQWSIDDLGYEYRSSRIKHEHITCVMLGITFSFSKGDPTAIKAKMDEYNDYRKRTQPPGATIGSMFKNPPEDYAGRLIDAAGLKGMRIGGAQISEKHANFFLNADDAAGADVKALVDLARSRVFDEFGVTLELEVELVGEW